MKNIDNGKTRQEKKGRIFNKGKEMKREQFLFSFFRNADHETTDTP